MITRITLLALCSFYFTCHAQQLPKHIATLTDGIRITGTIVSEYDDSLRIAVIRQDTNTIRKVRIATISSVEDTSLLSPKKGYQIQLTVGLLAGKTRIGNEYNVSVHLSNSYQFNNGLSLGIGCGAEYLAVPVLPLYGEVMYHFTNRLISPFVYFKTGYGFAFVKRDENDRYYNSYNGSDRSKGGFLFNAGIGIANFTWNKTAVTVGVGYRYQKVTQTLQTWNDGKRELISDFNRIEIKFGFLFR